jgi:hypothetical protein
MTNWRLARRDLLKRLGIGAACLPLLRATQARGESGSPKRFMIFQMSEGMRQQYFRPNDGSLLTGPLPPTLAGFEPHKADMIVIPGLKNPMNGGGHGSYGTPYHGLVSSGAGQYKEPTGPTVDQVVARAFPRPASGRLSLALHIQLEREPRPGTELGTNHCFWTGASQPVNPVGDPYAVYKDIFAGADTNPTADPGAAKKVLLQRKSILDYVNDTLTTFKGRLGTEDRASIDAHLESIRQLEDQLAAAPTDSSKCGGQPAAGINLNDGQAYPLIMKAHLGLMLAALKCGITRVATLQTGDSSGNNINFAFVPGVPSQGTGYKSAFRNWHDLGHNPVLGGVDHKRIVDKWFMDQWSAVFTQMKAIPEADGSLFDNTLTLVGNHMEDGANHNAGAVPWILFGGKNLGYFAEGQCLNPNGGRTANVNASISEAFGVPQQPFGPVLAGLKKA